MAVLESLEADTEEPPLCMGGNCGRSLSGHARLENRTADTLAFAVQGEQAYEFAIPPAPEAPGAFALIFGTDTVRVTTTVEGTEQKALVLPPGASLPIRFRVAASPPPPPGVATELEDERFWGLAYSDSVIVALAERLPEAELAYLPNRAGRYPFRVLPFDPVITSEQVGGDRWRTYWQRDIVRFARPSPAR
jgi:hypothetical protein